jgi:hypothetical protein
MPRISNIAVDQSVDKNDKLLGTNSGGGTKNYRLEDITSFIRDTGAAGVIGQFSYIFYNSSFGGSSTRPAGSMTISTYYKSVLFSDVTTIKVSDKMYQSSGVVPNAIDSFTDKQVIIAKNTDQNVFGVFTCTAVTQDPVETNFYDLTLRYEKGNGSLEVEQFYSIMLYAGAQDKEYRHDQNSASSTWTINHNLNKFPAVIVFDSAGSQAVGAITHDSKNQLTITFSASFSGIAYLN